MAGKKTIRMALVGGGIGVAEARGQHGQGFAQLGVESLVLQLDAGDGEERNRAEAALADREAVVEFQSRMLSRIDPAEILIPESNAPFAPREMTTIRMPA